MGAPQTGLGEPKWHPASGSAFSQECESIYIERQRQPAKPRLILAAFPLGSHPDIGSTPKKSGALRKIHNLFTQLVIAPKFCGAQFSQHARKQGFILNGSLRQIRACSQKLRRLGAVQHDFHHFSAALPYFLFANALVCSV
ncbi:hypothetical protein [Sinorhizobium fredii]|uniref:hypothetical protein n=1 Tax=Rhizobium fredii TaxID=380 RepID=UPI001FCBA376|nr:hypothetical protein [Sinorhizobium fredii]